MAKKRKSIATSLDEVDRTMYASFCTAANSLSQLYTHAMNHQNLSFHAGERHALEKLYQWIWRQEEGGSRVATVDVLNYIQENLADAATSGCGWYRNCSIAAVVVVADHNLKPCGVVVDYSRERGLGLPLRLSVLKLPKPSLRKGFIE